MSVLSSMILHIIASLITWLQESFFRNKGSDQNRFKSSDSKMKQISVLVVCLFMSCSTWSYGEAIRISRSGELVQKLLHHCFSILNKACNNIFLKGGGVLPIHDILRMCQLTGWVRENFAYKKGLLLTFCLTKRSPLDQKMPSKRVLFSWKLRFHP